MFIPKNITNNIKSALPKTKTVKEFMIFVKERSYKLMVSHLLLGVIIFGSVWFL
jgi:hypothetical protein